MAKHIVLVEDEPNIIEAISFILSRQGWQVTVHANGETAAEAIRKAAPDAVVLDVMLPGRSGYDILKDLREGAGLSAVPVLMLTARGQKKDRDMAEALGATRFMTKPFSNAELIAALDDIVGGGG